MTLPCCWDMLLSSQGVGITAGGAYECVASVCYRSPVGDVRLGLMYQSS